MLLLFDFLKGPPDEDKDVGSDQMSAPGFIGEHFKRQRFSVLFSGPMYPAVPSETSQTIITNEPDILPDIWITTPSDLGPELSGEKVLFYFFWQLIE